MMHEKIIHYHLGGTRHDALRFGGIKADPGLGRTVGAEQGYRWLNLGGGVNSTKDSLMEFKLRFSKITFDFQLASLVVDPARYAELRESRLEFEASQRLEPISDPFFPRVVDRDVGGRLKNCGQLSVDRFQFLSRSKQPEFSQGLSLSDLVSSGYRTSCRVSG